MKNALEDFFYSAQSFPCSSGVAFGQCANEPAIINIRRSTGICGSYRIDPLVQRSWIGFPIQFHCLALGFQIEVVWLEGQCAISHRFLFGIMSPGPVITREFVKPVPVPRVELSCPFEVPNGLFPASLTPFDGALQCKNTGVIR